MRGIVSVALQSKHNLYIMLGNNYHYSIEVINKEVPLWYSEVLIQLPISKLGRIPEEIYMGSKHLYDAIVM